jgi:O-antigen ligase
MVVTPLADGLIGDRVPLASSLSGLLGMALVVLFAMSGQNRIQWQDWRVRWFVAFAVVAAFSAVVTSDRAPGEEVRSTVRVTAQYLQPVVMYVLLHSLARDPRWTKRAMALYVSAAIAVAVVSLAAVGTGLVETKGAGRTGVAWMNLNEQAVALSIAVLVLFGWLLEGKGGKWGRPSFLLALLVLVAAVLQTGSRGAGIALIAGLTLAVALQRLASPKLLIAIGALGIVAVILAPRADVTMARFERTLGTGDTGLRLELADSSLQMYLERPWFGWGPRYPISLSARMGRFSAIATHNWYFQMLLAFGTVAFLPWICGLWKTLSRLFLHRHSPDGRILLSVMGMVVVVGLVGHLGTSKIVWVFLAICGNVERIGGRSVNRRSWRANRGRQNLDTERVSRRRDPQATAARRL